MDWQWITSVVCVLIGIFFIMTQTSDFKNGIIQGFIEENPGNMI